MLKIQEIREIIKLIDQSSIEKFTYESDGAKLELKKGSGTQAAVAPTVVEQVQPVQQEVSAAHSPVNSRNQMHSSTGSTSSTCCYSTSGRSIITQNYITNGWNILFSIFTGCSQHMYKKVIK